MSIMQNISRTVQLSLLLKDALVKRLPSSASRNGTTPQADGKLINRMLSLHGLPQKLGQILSLSELNQSEKKYERLTETDAVLSADEALAEIESHLSCCWPQHFRQFSGQGVAASLSQVHRAQLKDGRWVAVKIQIPGIAKAVDGDLKKLGWLAAPLTKIQSGFDLDAYRQSLGKTLSEELDYLKEAKALTAFAHLIQDWPHVNIPQVIPELTKKRILTMTWVEGESFEAVRNWSASERQQIAQTLLTLFCRGCFEWGVLHGDPHQGNYRFQRKDGETTVGLLDFGCMQHIDLETQSALTELILAAQRTLSPKSSGNGLDPDWAMTQFVRMGFNKDLLLPMKDRLPDLIFTLFMPFIKPGIFDTNEWNLADRVSTILGEHRIAFRVAGPPSLIFFMRAWQGLLQYISALNVNINWRTIFKSSHTQSLKSEEGEHDMESSNSNGVQEIEAKAYAANNLCIQVRENNETKVSLRMPVLATKNLPHLVPPEQIPKLEAKGVNLEALAQKAIDSGYAPTDLFNYSEGEKTVRVWLE